MNLPTLLSIAISVIVIFTIIWYTAVYDDDVRPSSTTPENHVTTPPQKPILSALPKTTAAAAAATTTTATTTTTAPAVAAAAAASTEAASVTAGAAAGPPSKNDMKKRSVVNDTLVTINKIIYENDATFADDENIQLRDRLNLSRARRYITEYSKIPTKLEGYRMMRKDSDKDSGETGVFNTWNKNTEDLSGICLAMLDAVRFLHTQRLKTNSDFVNDVPRIKAYVDDFIGRLLQRVEKIDRFDRVPWGKNWYSFTVPLPAFLAQYLLLEDSIRREEIAAFLLKIIPDPAHTFKTVRSKQCSIQLLGPWLLANHFNNTLAAALKNQYYAEARKNVLATVNYKMTDPGLHLDGTWIAYTPPMPAYGTLLDAIAERTVYYYYMDESLRNKVTLKDVWPIVNKIICHPTIALGNIGMFGRRTTNYSYTSRDAPLGIRVQPFSRYIRFYTADRQFNVRAQAAHLAYYQFDRGGVSNLARYWVQYRAVHTAERPKEEQLKYPMPGIIHTVGGPPDPSLLATATVTRDPTETCVGLLPKSATSFVMHYEHLGFMYQKYEIREFENYSVTELIVVNSETNMIRLQIDICNDVSPVSDLEYVLPDKSKIVIPKGTKKSVTITYNLYGETVYAEAAAPINLPIRYGTDMCIRAVDEYSSAYVLFVNNTPKIAAFDAAKDEPPTRVLMIDNQNVTFTFDTDANQYLCSSPGVIA